jgi:hypothetical protein
MNSGLWVLALTFIAVSIPAVLLMHYFNGGGEFRLMIAMGLGALATAVVQGRLAQRKDKQE